jgi:acetate kinase
MTIEQQSERLWRILVLNCGSFSLKFELVETSLVLMESDGDRALGKGGVDKIGSSEARVTYRAASGPAVERQQAIADSKEAVAAAMECLNQVEHSAGPNLPFDAAGHRVVHGGDAFVEPARMDPEVVGHIEEISGLAPLHNPVNLRGFYALRDLYPELPQVAVFDTAFHGTLPPHAYLYAVPGRFHQQHQIRRYGFHGTSHRYVATRYAHLRQGSPEQYNVITCHLGSGCSITAVKNGRSVDTSMGFTPLEGLVMGTRSGDIDPAAVLRMMEIEGSSPAEMLSLLNRESGLLALSGLTNDMRLLMQHREAGHPGAALAVEVFCYRIRKYVGAYLAVLNGADAIIFTGGVGEHQPAIRFEVCRSLEALGIRLDEERNRAAVGVEAEISAPGSPVQVWVIPTREELLIARETVRCLSAKTAPPHSAGPAVPGVPAPAQP